MSATMQNIADELGVSLMTVSLALNGKGKISSATRSRVLQTAARLGYRPNAAARATATGRFNNIALMLDSDISRDHLPPDLLYGIQQSLEKRGMSVSLAHLSDEQLLNDELMPSILRQINADGLIINYKHNVPPKLTDLLRQHRIPAVWIESDRENDCVCHDHVNAGATATRHLLEIGHTRIAFVDNHHGDPEPTNLHHFSLYHRREGYRCAMEEARHEPWLIHLDDATPKQHDRYAWVRSWLDMPVGKRPTAVVTYVNGSAIPVYLTALQMGMSVPGDLSIVSIGDRSEMRGLPLTHVALDVFGMGRVAVEMLLKKIDRTGCDLPTRRVAAKLVAGRTSAAHDSAADERSPS